MYRPLPSVLCGPFFGRRFELPKADVEGSNPFARSDSRGRRRMRRGWGVEPGVSRSSVRYPFFQRFPSIFGRPCDPQDQKKRPIEGGSAVSQIALNICADGAIPARNGQVQSQRYLVFLQGSGGCQAR